MEASRIVDRMDHNHRCGTVEDIPVLVDAIKGLISNVYYLREQIGNLEQHFAVLGHPVQYPARVWLSHVLANEFGVELPVELAESIERFGASFERAPNALSLDKSRALLAASD